ncbi:MAG TPA: HlyD family efflux transporter periplasmic adaptor subunit [Chitinophagaceae bacterium]|nr:HlyD family efflux transporter periplasmic adaptor subunit [Chitinophagaceae bacterium]
MDRVIAKKKWSRKRILMILGIAALVALIAGSIYYTSGPSKLTTDTDRIEIRDVIKGPFQETIPENGTVLPQNSIYLDLLEGGRVEEKYVEDGAMMKKGQPIIRLSNTNLELQLVTQQTDVYNLITQMQIAKNNALQNTVSKLNQMADVQSLLREAERVYNLDKKLYEQKAIGLQDLKKAENDYNYYKSKEKLTQQILEQDSSSNAQQLQQAQLQSEGSKNALNIMQQKVGDLIVRAPVDGQLTSLNAEIGENEPAGTRIGQIDVVGAYKVQVEPDEFHLNRIFPGLKGRFTLGDSTYQLVVKKVYSAVNTSGRFRIDMYFVGKPPSDLRRGQTLQILLALSDERQAIMIPKGGFFQQTGGNWIFKVSPDGTKATRVDIQLGNQNQDYFEVLSGLKPGDKVITSSYENYGNIQELVLKK